MNHPGSEQLVAHYYERDQVTGQHLSICPECGREFTRLCEWLDEVRSGSAVPEPDADYEKRLWAGVEPHLRRPRAHFRGWGWAAGIAAAAAFGFFSLRPRVADAPKGPVNYESRVVNAAVAKYLGQAQILLTEVTHYSASEAEQARARELVEDGRLLRASLRQHGDERRAQGLQDLEPTLLTLANSAAQMKPEEWNALQARVNDNGLVFKVTVMRSNLTK